MLLVVSPRCVTSVNQGGFPNVTPATRCPGSPVPSFWRPSPLSPACVTARHPARRCPLAASPCPAVLCHRIAVLVPRHIHTLQLCVLVGPRFPVVLALDLGLTSSSAQSLTIATSLGPSIFQPSPVPPFLPVPLSSPPVLGALGILPLRRGCGWRERMAATAARVPKSAPSACPE